MSFIKYDSAHCETTIKEIDNLNSELDTLKGLLESFSSNNLSDSRSYVPSTNPDGTETTSQDMALLSKINAFNAAVAKISGMSNIISGTEVKGKVIKIKDALVKVNEAVVEFNSTGISLKDALNSKEGITVDDNEVVYFTVGDNKYRLGDLVNCFYTEIGMNMNSAIAIGVLADGKTDIDVDKMIKATIESNDSFTNELLGAGYFGVASLADINATAEAAGVSANMSKDVASILGGIDLSKLNVEDMSDTELEMLKQALAGKTGSALTLSGAGLASVMLAAYGMNNPSKDEEKTTEVTTTPEEDTPKDPPGGNYGGGPTEAPTTLFEFVEISSEPIPEPLVIEMDFDELALEKFEALGEEQLNKLYSDVTSEVMTLFDLEDKSALIERLSKYGYSQSDIDMIILDREMAVNACIAGERRTLLAGFATELAKEGGFTDFESSYSGELKYGIDDSSDYVYALGDKDVAEAYDEFTAARAEYYEAVSSANTSITEAETAKTELETLKAELIKSAGDDTTKWTEEDVTKYNAAVTKYNTALQTSIDSVKATEDLKLKYESSKEDYLDAREEYIEELESLSNNIGTGNVPEVEYNGINTGVSGPVIEGVDYIAQAASDTIQTQVNSTEVIGNVTTNITDAVKDSAATITNNNFNNSTGIVTDNAASVEVLDLPVLNNAISNPTTNTTSGDSTFETPNISIKL